MSNSTTVPSESRRSLRTEARRAIRETALGELLEGYRGEPDADVDALASTLVDLGRLTRSESVAELDLNPILVDEDGVSIVDIFVWTA